jgi:nitrogen PTS system EIIA component
VKLTIREAAAMLNVAETMLYRWVDDGEIPYVTIQHRPLFHRLDLLEWAMERDLPISVDLYENRTEAPFATALEAGGGHVMTGVALGQIAEGLPIDAGDREVIGAVLAARSEDMFQARSGIAIPRPRSPLICSELPSMVQLWWCRDQALTMDGVPTKAIFVIITPTVLDHLQLLARLALLLRSTGFQTAVKRVYPLATVLAEARQIEKEIEAPRGSRSAR